ncbi:hypothetical protein MPC1_11410002 [Methylocella tundrae]|nr:hypothetical protein MPC1_11410002 [Methylocella tundrae]
MRIAVQAENDAIESRVAATPETVKSLAALGAEVTVETRAGRNSAILDEAYAAAGATIAPDAAAKLIMSCGVIQPDARAVVAALARNPEHETA